MTNDVAQFRTRKHAADLDRGLDPELLKRRMLELFRSPAYRPPLLPAVALELLELTRRPRTGAAEIVSLMGHDPVLAAQVLRLARSALYSGGQPLRSLDEAVTRLGLARISDLLLQVSLEATVFRAAGFREVMNSLRRHSVFVAEASRIVEKHVTSHNPSAFLCGLLHDVGVAACILALAGPLKGLAPLGFDAVWPSVGEVHAECSELLAETWGLPAEVASVLSAQRERCSAERPLDAVVCLADGFADAFGFAFASDVKASRIQEAASALALSEADLAQTTREVGELAKKFGS